MMVITMDIMVNEKNKRIIVQCSTNEAMKVLEDAKNWERTLNMRFQKTLIMSSAL